MWAAGGMDYNYHNRDCSSIIGLISFFPRAGATAGLSSSAMGGLIQPLRRVPLALPVLWPYIMEWPIPSLEIPSPICYARVPLLACPAVQ